VRSPSLGTTPPSEEGRGEIQRLVLRKRWASQYRLVQDAQRQTTEGEAIMSNTTTGGPAFPTERNLTQGMTLRDYFAAKAMQTFLQTINGVVGCNRYEYRIAENAYEIADAMLKARGS
jgi:hypothetical protein